MNSQTIAVGFLRVVGLLLIVLGLVHWAATPYIPPLLGESSSGVYQRAVGPTLLDHGLFGILLLPLGYTTWLAGIATKWGEASAAGKRGRCADFSGIPGGIYAPA